MRSAVALLTLVATCAQASAFDMSLLPQTCTDTLAEMQSEKPRFTQLGSLMSKYRKASNVEEFCKAARETVLIIKNQSSKLDDCVGDLANASTVPKAAVDQLAQLKSVYRQMLEAAKNAKNDRYHCSLADQ